LTVSDVCIMYCSRSSKCCLSWELAPAKSFIEVVVVVWGWTREDEEIVLRWWLTTSSF
jgi:hypothetical protein